MMEVAELSEVDNNSARRGMAPQVPQSREV